MDNRQNNLNIESDFFKFMEQFKRFVKKEQPFDTDLIKDYFTFFSSFKKKHNILLSKKGSVQKEYVKFKLEEINHYYENKIREAENILKYCVNNLKLPSENIIKNDKTTVEEYNFQILRNSIYPDFHSKIFELEYNDLNQTLVIDYQLPNIENLPKTKGFEYVSSKNIFNEIQLKPQELNSLYDSILYQIALRTNYELYKNDSVNVIANIVFNGWVQFVDKADGLQKISCILSIMTNKEEFLTINLANVEPKACFKKFKGIGSNELHGIAAIAPIINLNKKDKRFVIPYEVMKTVQEGYNLAIMDWQDFENLIREIFEKEFSQNGGEVKVTQASRDGGVDAIAFDPDPIRGGKIVIQAKRYTNTVGVSAVRDLYGTVLNEGAMKGILVTTADYGSDAYEFAKDKPITLLNGGNLLHLLEKHGHKARIDLKEAKQILTGN